MYSAHVLNFRHSLRLYTVLLHVVVQCVSEICLTVEYLHKRFHAYPCMTQSYMNCFLSSQVLICVGLVLLTAGTVSALMNGSTEGTTSGHGVGRASVAISDTDQQPIVEVPSPANPAELMEQMLKSDKSIINDNGDALDEGGVNKPVLPDILTGQGPSLVGQALTGARTLQEDKREEGVVKQVDVADEMGGAKLLPSDIGIVDRGDDSNHGDDNDESNNGNSDKERNKDITDSHAHEGAVLADLSSKPSAAVELTKYLEVSRKVREAIKNAGPAHSINRMRKGKRKL